MKTYCTKVNGESDWWSTVLHANTRPLPNNKSTTMIFATSLGNHSRTQIDARRRNACCTVLSHAVGWQRTVPIMHLTCRKRLLELVSEKLPFVCFMRPFFRAPLPTICGPKGNFRQEWDNIVKGSNETTKTVMMTRRRKMKKKKSGKKRENIKRLTWNPLNSSRTKKVC